MSPLRSALLAGVLFTAIVSTARADDGPELPGVELPGIDTSAAPETRESSPRESYTLPAPERSRIVPPRFTPEREETPVDPELQPEPYTSDVETPAEKPRGGFLRDQFDALRGKGKAPATMPERSQKQTPDAQRQQPQRQPWQQQRQQQQLQLQQQQQQQQRMRAQQQLRSQKPQQQPRSNTAPPANWRRTPQGMTPKSTQPQAKGTPKPDGFEQQPPTTPWREDITPPRRGTRPTLPSQQPGIQPQSNRRAPSNYQPASPYRAPQPTANNRTARTPSRSSVR